MNTDEIIFNLKALRVNSATIVIAEERDATNIVSKVNTLMQLTPFDEEHPLIVLTTTEQGYAIYYNNITMPNTYIWQLPTYVKMPIRAYILSVLCTILDSVLILNYYNAICTVKNTPLLCNRGKYTIPGLICAEQDATNVLYNTLQPYLLNNVAMVSLAMPHIKYPSNKINTCIVDSLPYAVVLYNLKALRPYILRGLPTNMTNGTFNLLFALYCAERGLTFTVTNEYTYCANDYEPTAEDYELLAVTRKHYPYLFTRKASIDLQYLYDLAKENRALLREGGYE